MDDQIATMEWNIFINRFSLLFLFFFIPIRMCMILHQHQCQWQFPKERSCNCTVEKRKLNVHFRVTVKYLTITLWSKWNHQKISNAKSEYFFLPFSWTLMCDAQFHLIRLTTSLFWLCRIWRATRWFRNCECEKGCKRLRTNERVLRRGQWEGF